MNKINIFQVIRIDDKEQFKNWLSITPNINVLNDEGEGVLQVAIAYKRTKFGLELLQNGINVNNQSDEGQTCLHYAIAHMNLELVKAILKANIKINISDKYGNTALWTAVFNARGNYEIVELLVSKGANAYLKNNSGRSPIDFAKQINDKELVSILEEGSNTRQTLPND